MTQVPVEEALRTMVYAFNDAVEAVYDEAQYMPDYGATMRMQHHLALLAGALETVIHILLYPLNPRLDMSDRSMEQAENYLGQYDEFGVAIVYPSGEEMMF